MVLSFSPIAFMISVPANDPIIPPITGIGISACPEIVVNVTTADSKHVIMLNS